MERKIVKLAPIFMKNEISKCKKKTRRKKNNTKECTSIKDDIKTKKTNSQTTIISNGNDSNTEIYSTEDYRDDDFLPCKRKRMKFIVKEQQLSSNSDEVKIDDDFDEKPKEIIIDEVITKSANKTEEIIIEEEEETEIEILNEDKLITNEMNTSKSESDDLWTSKYTPANGYTRVDNDVEYIQLLTWISEWNGLSKLWQQHNTSDSEDSFERYNYDDDSELKCCILIYGPPGIGKTSFVYTVAKELDFKVFEMNCSTLRNSRTINQQLKEATQSQIIYRNKSSTPATKTNADFTKIKQSVNEVKTGDSNKKAKQKQMFENFFNCKKKSEKQVNQQSNSQSSQTSTCSQSSLKFANNSLILFDDVDVLFSEDDGFWRTVNSFMETSKKPVILTATHGLNEIKNHIDNLKIIILKQPKSELVVKFLQTIMNDEGKFSSFSEKFLINLTNKFHCDIRRCINELQFKAHYPIEDIKENNHIIEKKVKKESKRKSLMKQLKCINKCYEYFAISDSTTKKFNFLNHNEKREHFLKQSNFLINENYNCVKLADNLRTELEKGCEKIFQLEKTFDENLRFAEKQEILLNLKNFSNFQNTSNETFFIDYLPFLTNISKIENDRLQKFISEQKRSRRFSHYLDSILIGLDDFTKNDLNKIFNEFQSSL